MSDSGLVHHEPKGAMSDAEWLAAYRRFTKDIPMPAPIDWFYLANFGIRHPRRHVPRLLDQRPGAVTLANISPTLRPAKVVKG